MIWNKGQLKVQGRSEANLAYRSLKENWGGGGGARGQMKKKKKRKTQMRERGRTGEVAQVVKCSLSKHEDLSPISNNHTLIN